MAARTAVSCCWLLPLVAVACCAGEADAVCIGFADGAQLEARWNASVFGRVWAEAGSAPLRARVDAWLAEAKRASGVDLAVAIRAARSMQLRFLGLDAKRQPRWAAQADLGVQAAPAARRLAAAEGSALPLVLAGADEAWMLSAQVLARFGGIVSLGRPAALLPLPPLKSEGDVAVDLDVAALLALLRGALEPAQAVRAGALLDLLAARWQTLALRATLDPDGVVWSSRFVGDTSGLKAVDRSVLARLPGNASTVQLVGFDGAAWWRAWGTDLLAALDPVLHDGTARGAEATLRTVRAAMAALGIDADLPAVISGVSGTIIFAQTPGAPIPGCSIGLPRSPALDALVSSLCTRLGCAAPVEGGYALLPIPDLPVSILLARDRGHWLISTDIVLASTWGSPGGFETTPLARGLLAAAPAEVCVLGVNDLAPTLRMSLGPIAMALTAVRELTPIERQAVIVAVARLAALLPPGYIWGVTKPGQLDVNGRGGDVLWLAVPAIMAAVAIPNLLESRVVANEAAAAATLKSGVFPSQVQFQAGAYQDADNDNIGEYGLISELSGRRPTSKIATGTIRLLSGPLAAGDTANGYRFASFLPDGKGGAIGEPAGDGQRPSIVDGAVVADADTQERFWVAYAWPLSTETGRRIFAIDQTGQVYTQTWDGGVPQWNALYAGGTWGGKAAWSLYQRRARPAAAVP